MGAYPPPSCPPLHDDNPAQGNPQPHYSLYAPRVHSPYPHPPGYSYPYPPYQAYPPQGYLPPNNSHNQSTYVIVQSQQQQQHDQRQTTYWDSWYVSLSLTSSSFFLSAILFLFELPQYLTI